MRVIVKLSGKTLDDHKTRESVCREILTLARQGIQILLVHGGGRQLSAYCESAGIPVAQYQGRRITDEVTLEAAKMVFSAINRDLTATLCSLDVKALGFAAFDAGMTESNRRPPIPMKLCDSGEIEAVDFGLVGEIKRVKSELIEVLWAYNYLPVISCLCADADGRIMNINADTLAAEFALSLRADRLISVSDTDGIYTNPKDPTTRIPSMDIQTARDYLKTGIFVDGMVPKVETAIRAVEQGVHTFQVLNGLQKGALSRCTRGEVGTVLVP
jgi:acetylglutamate kinase